MTVRRLPAAMWLAVALAGCALNKPVPQATTYAIDTPVSPPNPAAATDRVPTTLRMGRVRIAAAFSGTALVYRMDEVKFVSDPYSAFIADPAAMLGDQMAVWLNNTGPFQTVALPESTQAVSYVLEAHVTELYGDFRTGRSPAAVLAMQLTLLDLTGARPRSVLQRSIAKRLDIAHPTAEALVQGYGVALADLLTELESELQATLRANQRIGDSVPRH